MKGHKELDDKRNIMLVCSACHHSGIVNGFEARRWFWQRQCERYGQQAMQEFWEGVCLKAKERFD